MAVYEAIILGIGTAAGILFWLWKQLRDDHENLAMLFFGIGLAVLNIMIFFIGQFIENEAAISYMNDNSYLPMLFIMWLSIGTCVYILGSLIVNFLKVTFHWAATKLGLKLKGED